MIISIFFHPSLKPGVGALHTLFSTHGGLIVKIRSFVFTQPVQAGGTRQKGNTLSGLQAVLLLDTLPALSGLKPFL